jgi:hypothetical protein
MLVSGQKISKFHHIGKGHVCVLLEEPNGLFEATIGTRKEFFGMLRASLDLLMSHNISVALDEIMWVHKRGLTNLLVTKHIYCKCTFEQ